jgi:NADH dehydrogenase/NADH:ubiquinone oxidoreductase subunit G
VQARGNDPLRILPVKNDSINQDWISDKTRFCLDAFSAGRNMAISSISDLFTTLCDKVSFDSAGNLKIQFVAGPHTDLETLSAAQAFSSRFGANTVLLADTSGDLSFD